MEVFDFIDGQLAAREGKPLTGDESDAFKMGYAVEYELQEMVSANEYN